MTGWGASHLPSLVTLYSTRIALLVTPLITPGAVTRRLVAWPLDSELSGEALEATRSLLRSQVSVTPKRHSMRHSMREPPLLDA